MKFEYRLALVVAIIQTIISIGADFIIHGEMAGYESVASLISTALIIFGIVFVAVGFGLFVYGRKKTLIFLTAGTTVAYVGIAVFVGSLLSLIGWGSTDPASFLIEVPAIFILTYLSGAAMRRVNK